MSISSTLDFDIIFAGGGTTACVVAGRLAACDPSLKILVLEAGPHTLNEAACVQPYLYPTHLAPWTSTVSFVVGNSSPRLNDRAPIASCGRCVGGGSSVNFMVYTRAPASDFYDWRVDGWESENLIPIMKKPDCATHGYNGPIKVSSGGYKLNLGQELIDVGKAYHKRPYADDTDDLETCNTYSSCVRRYIDGTTGRRSDAAHHYVYNQAHNTNLQIWAGKRVKRVIFEDKRAVGVEFTSDSVSCPGADLSSSTVRASKLVVVSAGAFGSPTILERSGIGSEAVLKRCGIEQLVNLPGVGENYQDHQGAFAAYNVADNVVTMDPLWRGEESAVQECLAQWKRDGRGLVAQNGGEAKIKWRPDDDELSAMGSAFQPRWKEFFQDRPDKNSRNIRHVCGLYPASVGSVHVKLEENGKEGIDFTPGYLDDPSDIVPLNFGYKKMRELYRRMPSYRGEIPASHPMDLNAPDIIYTPEDDAAIEKFHLQTMWHSLVVDARLNVYGVTNLKVADMSMVPKNVGTNTYSMALLIGEKAAMIIAEDLGIDFTTCPSWWESSEEGN
ncbi:alcohol oxidase [Rhizopogon vinicolor AM-OR11-026]|uniref:Alcohol oxidase n=1 Tax=Rhizopogon vinicolor AM-OR11-026 TaxID=1314800 RepID=A0A1B7N7K6_9AGAM|nr:alcohol oxidase [Rhizopogon vinicolor AM-OR11-026]